MAYKSDNLQQIFPRMGTGENAAADDGGYAVALWSYRALTGDNTLANMQAVSFITDGHDKGLRVGDVILFVEDATDSSWGLVSAIDADGLVTTIIVSNP